MHPTALLLGLSALLAYSVLNAGAFVGNGDCEVSTPYTIRSHMYTNYVSSYEARWLKSCV